MADEGAEAARKAAGADVPAVPAGRSVHDTRLYIRSYPKTIFFYPTAITAVVCGFLQQASATPSPTLGFAFMVVFAFNVFITTFEFRKHTPVVLALVGLVVALAFTLLNERFGIASVMQQLYRATNIAANGGLYFAVATTFCLAFLGIFVSTRFECWEVRGNELLHHTGMLGDTERLPASSLRFKKEITDVFEFLLLASGRIVLYPSGRDRPVVIDNVPRVNDVAARMEALLDAMRVSVETVDQ